jgi:hypothetical protein
MRWVSSKESVAKGEVSVLAIVETLCAIALVFWLSSHFNTLRWLAIAMCVSPLLLLRTEESTRLGIKWWDRFKGALSDNIRWLEDLWLLVPHHNGIMRMPMALAVLLVFSLGSTIVAAFAIVLPLVVRMAAAGSATIQQPWVTLKTIPTNWFRITFAMDVSCPPEKIPGHSEENLSKDMRKLYEETNHVLLWPLRILGWPSMFAIFYLPALIYRWSLKATSIIYSPLVFVAHSTFSESKDLRTKLELIKRGDLSRIRVWYGVIAIAAFLVKLVLMMNLPGFADWWNGHPVSRFLAIYVAPAEIPKWQLAELGNSVLAIGSMLFARHALLRYELQHPWPEVPVKSLLGFVSALRWLLALYAIVCTGYITMNAAQHWRWPALGEKWIPWQ